MSGAWTLLHTRSPLNTTTGTGQWGELTQASSRGMTFDLVSESTLTFTMPGNHRETSLIEPRESDVLVFRDDVPVQRYRVISRTLSKSTGVLTAQFGAVSYKKVPDAWIVHGSDTRSWTSATEQTAMAWTVLSEGQARSQGALGMTRGITPGVAVNRVRGPITDSGTGVSRPYLDVGKKRAEFVRDLADNLNGFEWDIEPSRSAPYTALEFNAWNLLGRGSGADIVLDDGGAMASWTHTMTSDTYLNTLFLTGDQGATGVAAGAWYPVTENPSGVPPEGRWERQLSDTDVGTSVSLTEKAPEMYRQAHDLVPQLSCVLAGGVWRGPNQLWVGDTVRIIITEPVMDVTPQEYVLYVDESVRVTGVNVSVDDLGGEVVTLALVRPAFWAGNRTRTVDDRLSRLERR